MATETLENRVRKAIDELKLAPDEQAKAFGLISSILRPSGGLSTLRPEFLRAGDTVCNSGC